MKNRLMFTLMFCAGCGMSGTIDGTLSDAITGDGIAGVQVTAKATEPSDMTCGTFQATTDETGAFSIVGTCASDDYMITAGDKSLLLSDMEAINGANKDGQTAALKAWKAPQGVGFYKLSEGKLEALRKPSELETVKVWKQDQAVRYPKIIPSKIPSLAPGDHLVITGQKVVDSLSVEPLVASEARRFGDRQEPWTMDPWSYIGFKFESDTVFEKVTAELDASKVSDVTARGHTARFIAADALAAGRYILTSDADKRRGTIVDFGTAAE